MKQKRIILSLAIFSLIFGLSLFGGESAYARVSNTYYSGAVQKALLFGVKRCYGNGILKGSVDKISEFRGLGSLVTGGTDQNFVRLPNGLTPIDDDNLSCQGFYSGDDTVLFSESGHFEGMFSLSGQTTTASTKADKEALLKNFGYTKDRGRGSKKCVTFKYSSTLDGYGNKSSETKETESVCATMSGDKISKLSIEGSAPRGSYSLVSSYFKVEDNKIKLINVNCTITQYGESYQDTKCSEKNMTSKGVGDTWDEFLDDLTNKQSTYGTFHASMYDVTYEYKYIKNSGTVTSDGDTKFTNNFNDASVNSVIKFLSNGTYSKVEDLKLTDAEELALDLGMLKEFYYDGVDINSYWKCDVANWAEEGYFYSNYIEIKVNPSGQANNNCRLNKQVLNSTNKSKKVMNVIGGFPAVGLDNSLDFDGLVARINALAGTVTEEEAAAAIDNSESDPEVEDNPCYDDAGALGWIACPALSMLSDTASSMYDTIEKNYLQIDAKSLFDTTSPTSNATFQAWKTVRDISNVIFVILIFIIIFSQLTGVGIDNYGIKRTLPRLIIAAILVNASWFICKFAVDVSNILGVGLRNLLTVAPIEIDATVTSSGSGPSLGQYIFTFGGASAIGIAAVLVNPGIILAALVGALSIVISILFLWFILLAREVGVIASIIIAPLAFVCYLLPNTEKLFKRWVSLVKALLLLYPICSLVIGAGHLAGYILASAASAAGGSASIAFNFDRLFDPTYFFAASDTNGGLRLAAMVVQVLPYFAIPMLLKNSLAGLGNIGAKISGFGKNLRANTSRKIKTSDAYQDRRMRMNAGYDAEGNQTKFGKFRQKTIGKTKLGSRALGRQKAAYLKDRAEMNRSALYADPVYMRATMAAQDSAMNKEMVEAEMSNMKEETANYSPAVMQQQLAEYLRGKKGALTDEDGKLTTAGLRTRALMKKMSTSGGFNQKNMTDIFRKAGTDDSHPRISAENMKFAAKFMQSDSDVASAMTRNMKVAQHLRDINDNAFAGIKYTNSETGEEYDLASMTTKEWEKASMSIGDGDDKVSRGQSNGQFVVNKVVDKDEDFIKQSDGAIEESIKEGHISDERLRGIYNNELLYNTATDGVKHAIAEKLGLPVDRKAAPAAPSTPPEGERISSLIDPKTGQPFRY